jgi:hypothetical protein
MEANCFYLIKLLKIDYLEENNFYFLNVGVQDDKALAYHCSVKTEEEESELISLLRKSGVFTNVNRSLDYKLSLVKTSCSNPQHTLVLCTRFYSSLEDAVSVLQHVHAVPKAA